MATVWPFLPNIRRQPYVMSREYRTEVISSRAGKEQRRALRQTPRMRVEYLTGVTGDCLRDFDRSMVTAQREQLSIPDRVRSVTLDAGLDGGATAVNLNPVPSWVEQSANLLLVSKSRVAARTVASVAGSTVTFSESETASWPPGTRLHPALQGYLEATIKAPLMSLRRGIVDVSVVFEVDPGSSPAEDIGSASVAFSDREVFLTKPTRLTQITLDRVQESAAKIDFGMGRVTRFFPVGFATRVWGGNYVGCDFDHADAIRQFFDRMKGRRGEFHMPTWQRDMVPVSGVTAAGTTLIVEGDFGPYTDDTVFKAIGLRKTDGTWLLRRITAIAPSGGTNSQLTVDSAWGETVALADIDMVSWLPVWRFASDILSMSWPRENAAEMQLSFQIIEDVAPEGTVIVEAPGPVDPNALAYADFAGNIYEVNGATSSLTAMFSGTDPAAFSSGGMKVVSGSTNRPVAIGTLPSLIEAGLTNGITLLFEMYMESTGAGGTLMGVNDAGFNEVIWLNSQPGAMDYGSMNFGTVSIPMVLPGINRVAFTLSRDLGVGTYRNAVSVNGSDISGVSGGRYQNLAYALGSRFAPVAAITLGDVADWGYPNDFEAFRKFIVYPPMTDTELMALSALP